MIFERPELLALAPLAAILFAFTVGAHWRRLRRLAMAYELTALRRLLPTSPGDFPTQRFLCLVGAGALLGLAAPSEEIVERTEATPIGLWFLLASMPILLLGSALRGSRWGVLP